MRSLVRAPVAPAPMATRTYLLPYPPRLPPPPPPPYFDLPEPPLLLYSACSESRLAALISPSWDSRSSSLIRSLFVSFRRASNVCKYIVHRRDERERESDRPPRGNEKGVGTNGRTDVALVGASTRCPAQGGQTNPTLPLQHLL